MKAKLLLKVQHQVSDHESIEDIDSLLDEAIVEADDLIKNKDVGETVRFDIAYTRFLLFVTQTDLSESEMKTYTIALEMVKKAPIKEVEEDETTSSKYCFKVATRKVF